MRGTRRVRETPAQHYDRRGVLGEVIDAPAEFALDEELREQILRGKGTRRLQNISIKLDPAQIQALRKNATIKAIPYQTLMRRWLAEGIRRPSDHRQGRSRATGGRGETGRTAPAD